MAPDSDDDVMDDDAIAELARQERRSRARVYVGGAIVLALFGLAFVIVGVVVIHTPIRDAGSEQGDVLGAGVGMLAGAGMLVARSRRIRRGVTRR